MIFALSLGLYLFPPFIFIFCLNFSVSLFIHCQAKAKESNCLFCINHFVFIRSILFSVVFSVAHNFEEDLNLQRSVVQPLLCKLGPIRKLGTIRIGSGQPVRVRKSRSLRSSLPDILLEKNGRRNFSDVFGQVLPQLAARTLCRTGK